MAINWWKIIVKNEKNILSENNDINNADPFDIDLESVSKKRNYNYIKSDLINNLFEKENKTLNNKWKLKK